MLRILYPPFPDDLSVMLPCRFRGAVVEVRKCEICGAQAGPKGSGVPIRECRFQAEDGSTPHPLCAHSPFESIRRVAYCTICEDQG